MRVSFLLVLSIVTASVGQAQNEVQFDRGLAVSQVHHYGRDAVVKDQLAYLLYSGQLPTPRAGGMLPGVDEGADLVWSHIEADSTGRFRGDRLMNGYIYLTYNSPRSRPALLNVRGNSMVYFNGEPRAGDIYSDGWLHLPVMVKKGLNEVLIRCGRFSRWQGVSARLVFPDNDLFLSVGDATLPHIVVGKEMPGLSGAIVVVNVTNKRISGLFVEAELNGKISQTRIPDIGPLTLRKVPFTFDPSGVSMKGDYACRLRLMQNGSIRDEQSLTLTAVNPDEHHSYTFVSAIDGSLQYYSVAPQAETQEARGALFLSVHGAGVEAIGQARAYRPKDWGTLVAATNRRPRGFNWEDWGRVDALEVLEHAIKRIKPDPAKIYLTGHSMGGHGTWYLGATYPDKWAAIAPCAGYPTLTAYGSADGRIPDSARTEVEKTLLRSSHASDVLTLASNYKHHGVYIFHGDADRVVPVTFARQMRDSLGKFHPDFSYYEYPGGSHWFGNESVDWPPIFDYFRWHTLKPDSSVDVVDFVTASPAISSTFRWAAVVQQSASMEYSRIKLVRDKKARSISGRTENVAILKLLLNDFAVGETVKVHLDDSEVKVMVSEEREVYLRKSRGWHVSDRISRKEKGPHRAGPFKEGFNHGMQFVYATSGNATENAWAYNKARYDAEVWYYRGNGAVDVIADRDFDPSKSPDRNVVLYGNAQTNSAWNELLGDCPIQVTREQIKIGPRAYKGSDLGAYLVWPRSDSETASVAVIAGTGPRGLHATDANQYFAAGSGFPDYMVFSLDMLRAGAAAIKEAGFFDNEWSLRQDK